MIDVKTLTEDDYRAAHTLFRAAIHHPPADDTTWPHAAQTFEPGRVFGAYTGGTLVGTAMSFVTPMTVPGGATLPSAAVTRVGVRADHTRRGALTSLMREQLAAVAAAGEPLASLRASEYPIYGRFGYGVATRGRDVELDPRRAQFHPAARIGGRVRLLDPDELPTVLPELHGRIGARRPGGLQRPESWWNLMLNRPGQDDQPRRAAVHTGPDGDEGFVVYHAEHSAVRGNSCGVLLQVDDLHAAGPQSLAALWRFVLGVDLVNMVRGWMRPVDEPLELLLADARTCRTTSIGDEAWLRLVDVPVALGARSWAGTDAVLLRVRDSLLPVNAGTYRITSDGVSRVDEPAQLECDVAVLGRLYLGDVAPSVLAASGWLTAHDPAALQAADALFETREVPWSGTFF